MPALSPDALHLLAAFGAALFAAAINSVAGGGTLITFPILVWLGLPSVVANATSAVGIWPGSLGSIWGFRRELSRTDRRMGLLVLPCLAGGAAGALLLRATTSAVFDEVVPFLILFATAMFALRGLVQRWLRSRSPEEEPHRSGPVAGALAVLPVAVYGGYFGAGMSIMNLSMLGMLACHQSPPSNGLGGPHGMHPVGSSWVSAHPNYAERRQSSCQPCHGTDYRGTVLSRMFATRTLAGPGPRSAATPATTGRAATERGHRPLARERARTRASKPGPGSGAFTLR